MFFIGIIFSLFASYNVQMTVLHQNCLRGDKASCEIEKRENIYTRK